MEHQVSTFNGVLSPCHNTHADFIPSINVVSELAVGNHMYLFAIKLPDVNYPPTLRDNYIDHKVDYTLQGFLDVVNPDQELQTHAVHITYLPLVTCQPTSSSPIQRRKTYQKGDQLVQVNAELKQPAHCPGKMDVDVYVWKIILIIDIFLF
jgi:hypothetical protein